MQLLNRLRNKINVQVFKSLSRNIKQKLSGLWLSFAVILLELVLLFMMVGVYLYAAISAYFLGVPAFDLAILSALLGGFTLSGGFIMRRLETKVITLLRRTGILYFLATVAFIVFGTYTSLDKFITDNQGTTPSWFGILVPASLAIGVAAFTVATGFFMRAIPHLWKK